MAERLGRLIALLGVGAWALLVSGCDSSRPAKEAVRDLEKQLDTLSKSVSDFVQDPSIPEEVKKLQQFEYQIVTVPGDVAPAALEATLSELGKNRWDCFHVERLTRGEKQELMLFLKRRPDTPLKYVPKTILGS